MSYTYATLEVPEELHALVAGRLKRADYHHAILDDGETLDMHGIALVKEKFGAGRKLSSDEKMAAAKASAVERWGAERVEKLELGALGGLYAMLNEGDGSGHVKTDIGKLETVQLQQWLKVMKRP